MAEVAAGGSIPRKHVSEYAGPAPDLVGLVTDPPVLPHIAIVGKAGSGKTTGAQFLARNYGYAVHSFAATLKDVAFEIWGEGARTSRDKLQKLGVAVRDIDEDAWVNVVRRKIAATVGPVVIDDCRFPNELWALKEAEFVFIHVACPEISRIDRLQRNGKLTDLTQLQHVSETALDEFAPHFDYEIENTTDEDTYEGVLLEILEHERRKR